ncbi:methyltransferase [Thioalkalivibrio denitrificans]|uniref:Methyltransferase n=1 Tax=Thioalkalivibrio denitrificans TaxID=108003 RepID=A0A1V3NCB1_9GAMM|nr:methyltransferase [Thioalkalivibrio denitrificans]
MRSLAGPLSNGLIPGRRDSTSAVLGFLPETDESPVQYAYPPPPGVPWENAGYDHRSVEIVDARRLRVRPWVDSMGFDLWDAPSAVRDFRDHKVVREIYYAEARELALMVTGGREAYVFDHLVRRRGPGRTPLNFGRGSADGFAPANGRLHNDFTEASGRQRLALDLPDPDARRNVQSFCIINIWRPINGPVLDAPLALCDARTVSTGDLVEGEVRYPNRTGWIYLCRHSPWQRWYYYSAMDRNEALVFKQYDSVLSGVSRFTPHGAFDHPQAPPDAPPRESIEVRCLVTF